METKNAIDINALNPELTGAAQALDTSEPESSLSAPEGEEQAVGDPDPLTVLIALMERIERSVGGLHVIVRAAGARLSQVEAHVAYLLEKDPKAGVHIRKIKEAIAAADAVASAATAAVAEAAKTVAPEMKDEQGAKS